MESTPHEEWQDVFGRLNAVAFRAEELQFLREEQPRDVELHVVGELVENELLADARVKLRAHRLLRTREDVAFERGEGRVLQTQHIGGGDVGSEDDVEAA